MRRSFNHLHTFYSGFCPEKNEAKPKKVLLRSIASGIAPVRKYFDSGVPVSIAVDGCGSNDGSHMLNEVRAAMMLARVKMGLRPPEGPETILFPSSPLRSKEWLTAREALEIATRGGAEVLNRDDIGSLAPGKCADFISIDMNGSSMRVACTTPWRRFFSAPRFRWTIRW